MCSNLHTVRNSDPRLQEWIERFDELMRTPGEIERCRDEYLTPRGAREILEEEAWSRAMAGELNC